MANIVVPETVRVWKIGVDQANVQSWNHYTNNQGYNLFCMTNGRFGTYKDISVGFNFGFNPTGDNKTHFRLPDGQREKSSQVSLSRSGLAANHRLSSTHTEP